MSPCIVGVCLFAEYRKTGTKIKEEAAYFFPPQKKRNKRPNRHDGVSIKKMLAVVNRHSKKEKQGRQ